MYNHFAYAEKLARSLKDIGHRDDEQHYLKFDEAQELEDLAQQISSLTGMILVAIDGHNSDFSVNGADALLEIPQYFIVILKSCPQGETDLYYSTKQDCKNVGFECIKKMLLDRIDERDGLQYLDAGSITCRGVGPIGDNFYGVIIGFTMNDPKSFSINPNMWM